MKFIQKIKLLLVLQLLIVVTASAQQKIRLTNRWEFLKQDLGSVWEAVRPVPKGAPESVPLWDTVFLPHCVNATDAVDADVNYYQGPAWYRSQLKIDNPYQDGRTLLHFEGAGQKTQVFVYTTQVGTHVGGYDEWTVDITDAVENFKSSPVYKSQFDEMIPVSIRTDNSRDTEMIPSSLSDFNIYGGIYRYLNLVYAPPVSFDKVFVKAETDASGKSGTVSISTRFYNLQNIANGELVISLISPEGKNIQQSKSAISLAPGNHDVAHFEVKKPQRWSPQSPKQYRVSFELKTESGVTKHEERFGFRHFEFIEHGPFKLNGERLLLRGTHRHEDHAGVGAAMTQELMRTEMIMMKEMGVNFIRLGHYQQSEIILDLCDSLGILVWEEIPWCRGGLGGETYQMQAKRMLTNMVEQHFNHPSIIIWGLGNENDWPGDFPEFEKEKIRTFMKTLNDLSHTLDPSRKTAIRRCDFCKDIVDVYSPSIWAGWYRGVYTEYKSVSESEMQKVKHFLHVEWGGDSHAGRHSENPDAALGKIIAGKGADERAGDASLFGGPARISKDGDWSESYICNLIDWHLKEQETMPWLTGTAYWPFKDFSTPVRPDNPVPYVNQKGVVERDFGKKESYYVFQSWWTEKPMVHIYGHSWPVRWGEKDESKMVKVYSNCDEAELFLNGKSQGVMKRNSQDFPASGLRWMVAFQEGENLLKVKASKGKIFVEDELSFVYQTTTWEQPAQLILEKKNSEEGIVTVQVRLVDKNGTQCMDAAQFVRFRSVGSGKLIDHQGTSDGSDYVQMYNGRAEIKMRTANGKNVISAEIKGLPIAFLEL
jgi:beta-galactosidase